MARTEMFAALRERQFRLLWIGQATSVFGNGLVPVALAFAVLGLTGSASDVGFVLAAETVPMVVFLLAGGVWADRLPRQLVMLGSDAIRGSCQATIAVLLLTDQARLWHLLALSSIYGSAEAFFRPAATGLLPSTVGAPRLQQANALMGVSNSVASLAGPAIAGVLVGLAGVGVAFAADAGTFVVSGVSLAMLR
ncbi:MAG: MFS transporter, partial [Gaiellaceae bacterium]